MSYFQCSDSNSTTQRISTICWAMLKRKKRMFSLYILAAWLCEMAYMPETKVRTKTNQKILLRYLPWFDSKHNSIITENCWNLKAKWIFKTKLARDTGSRYFRSQLNKSKQGRRKVGLCANQIKILKNLLGKHHQTELSQEWLNQVWHSRGQHTSA